MSFDELYEGGFIFECKECIPPGSQKALSWIGAGKRERATWPEWRLLKAALLIAEEHWEGKTKRQGVGGETSAAAFREMRLRIF